MGVWGVHATDCCPGPSSSSTPPSTTHPPTHPQTYADFLTFLRLCNERVRGISVSEEYPHENG